VGQAFIPGRFNADQSKKREGVCLRRRLVTFNHTEFGTGLRVVSVPRPNDWRKVRVRGLNVEFHECSVVIEMWVLRSSFVFMERPQNVTLLGCGG
jgi:hypothetical protein